MDIYAKASAPCHVDRGCRRVRAKSRRPPAYKLRGRRNGACGGFEDRNRLFILRKGNVAIIKEGIEIARVSEPGAVFGEISALLDCPHTADVRALASSQFHVVDPAALQDPAALFYIASILARRIDGTNQALVALKSEIHEKPRSVIEIAIKRMERLLSASGTNFPHDGYSYNSRA